MMGGESMENVVWQPSVTYLLLIYTWEVLGSNIHLAPTIQTGFLFYGLQYLQPDAAMVPQIRPLPLPFKSSSIHYSLLIL